MRKETLLRLLNRFGMSATLILLGLILLVAPDSAAVIIAYLMGGLLTFGGIVFGTISGIVFSLICMPTFDIVNIGIMSFLMSIVGQIGDLILSANKRHFEIK